MSERSKWEESVVADDEALEMAPVFEELLRSPGWLAYQELLKGARVGAREQAFNAGKESFEYYQGLVAGLQSASTLPGNVIDQASRSVKRAKKVDAKTRRRLPPVDDGDTVV